MVNRIGQLDIQVHRLTPTEAELWVRVTPEHLEADLELHGRLIGPRCLYASTVEVAYPLRRAHPGLEAVSGLLRRVVIPEPSLWDPESPFLYQGPIELWAGSNPCDRREVRCGLRTIQRRRHRLLVNGKVVAIRGRELGPNEEIDPAALRRNGINALLTPLTEDSARIWNVGDQFGFLMIGRLQAAAGAFQLAQALRGHPSCFGWILPPETLDSDELRKAAKALATPPGAWLGMELDQVRGTLPPEVHFLLCRQDQLALLAQLDLPALVRNADAAPKDGGAEGPSGPTILGYVTYGEGAAP